jgi:hypothetical protein
MTKDSGSGTAPIQRTLLRASPVEGLPEWETRLYLIEYPPGADGSGHYHPGEGVGYVLAERFFRHLAEKTLSPFMKAKVLWMLPTKFIRFPGTRARRSRCVS